jgi:hypothetical protein
LSEDLLDIAKRVVHSHAELITIYLADFAKSDKSKERVEECHSFLEGIGRSEVALCEMLPPESLNALQQHHMNVIPSRLSALLEEVADIVGMKKLIQQQDQTSLEPATNPPWGRSRAAGINVKLV